MDVDIFSDELGNGNEAGRDMNFDPTDCSGASPIRPNSSSSTASRANNSTTPTSNDVARRRQRPCASQEAQGRFALQ